MNLTAPVTVVVDNKKTYKTQVIRNRRQKLGKLIRRGRFLMLPNDPGLEEPIIEYSILSHPEVKRKSLYFRWFVDI